MVKIMNKGIRKTELIWAICVVISIVFFAIYPQNVVALYGFLSTTLLGMFVVVIIKMFKKDKESK
jgi:hypothetical protein